MGLEFPLTESFPEERHVFTPQSFFFFFSNLRGEIRGEVVWAKLVRQLLSNQEDKINLFSGVTSSWADQDLKYVVQITLIIIIIIIAIVSSCH